MTLSYPRVKFEDRLKRLEEIVSDPDEGLLLTKGPLKRLDKIEKSVEIVIKKENGLIERKLFLQGKR